MCLVCNKFLVSFVYVSAFYPSLKLNKWELVVCLESVFRCVEQIKRHLQVSCSIAAVTALSSFLFLVRNCNSCICNSFPCWECYYVMWLHSHSSLAHNGLLYTSYCWAPKSWVPLSLTNEMQGYTIFFIAVNAVHVSGGFSAYHQELKTVHTQHLVYVKPACCYCYQMLCVQFWAPDDRWENCLKHVEHWQQQRILHNVAPCWLYLKGYINDAWYHECQKSWVLDHLSRWDDSINF